MTNMQRLVVVLAFLFAVLLGVLIATEFVGKGGPTPSPAASSPAGSLASPSAAPSSSAAPSASSAASPTPSPSPSPTPTLKPGPTATIEFVQLALDATSDANGTTRTISFAAQPGQVTVKLKTESGGNTIACLLADGNQVACRTAVGGTLTATNNQASSNYQVTLRGDAAATPVVDVTIAFPAAKPKVTIRNAHFDGTDFPATNGLQVIATARANGSYHVAGAWGGHPFLYEVDLIEQGGPGLKQFKATQGATKASLGFAVVPPHGWMIVLKNSEAGFGTTLLVATFTWP